MPAPQLNEAMHQAGALLQAGRPVQARKLLQAITREHPDCAEALRMLAVLYQGTGDREGAETLLRQALASDPGWAPTLASLGELLLPECEQEALPLLHRAATRMPHAAVVLARHLDRQKRSAEVLAVLEPWCQARKLAPELLRQHAPALADIQFTRASILLAQGHHRAAEASLREALRLQPCHEQAHDHLARLIWMRSGDIDQTTATLDRALQTFPANPVLLATRAALLQGAGDARGAHACLAPVVAHAGAEPFMLVRAGLSALEFDSASARKLAERALEQAPDNAPARSLMAAALLGEGEPREALVHCEKLLAATPDDQYLIALQTTAWRLLGDARHEAYCDYAHLVRRYRLPVPPGWTRLDDYLAQLKQSLEKLHAPHGHPLLFQSLRHGTETTAELTRLDDPVIQALFRAFDAPIRDYMAHIGHGNDALRRRNHGSYRYNGSWSVRLRDQGFHASHVHPRGWISSAFYVALPASMRDTRQLDGCLSFGQPGIPTTPELPALHHVHPQVGELVLFPSHVWHGTKPFRGHDARITVAFDAVPDTPTR